MSAKKTTTFNLLYIFLILKNYSSATHPMSVSEILAKVNHTFKDGGEDLTINTSTITRILEPLRNNENFAFPDADDTEAYTDPHNIGFSLHCVVKQGSEWITYDPDEHANLPKYYYCKSIFSDAELKILIDAVEIYNYFSPENITTLIGKLLSLSPTSSLKDNDAYLPDSGLKDTESMVLNNIEDFNRMISEKKFAQISYCNYGFNPKTNQLEPVIRAGYPRTIRPVSMMWSNGYYYLIAMLGSSSKYTPANLRMDRILIIGEYTPTPEEYKEFEPPRELSPTTYRLNHPVMFGGKKVTISMLCRETPSNGMLNAVMDTFGTLAHCRPATQKELKDYLGYGTTYSSKEEENWIHIRVNATCGGVELFATQYCANCRVISPDDVVERIKHNLERGTAFYS